jgi:serine/threonine protein kinase
VLLDRLGKGSFGEVWRGVRSDNAMDEVALKIELIGKSPKHYLKQEAEVLKLLWEDACPQGVTECYGFGKYEDFHYIVMEKLGYSLRQCAVERGGRLSLLTSVLVAEQLIQRIEYLHSKGMIHRDIKPENFMFGIKERAHHVYMIDFGLSKNYWERDGAEGKGKHIPMKSGYRRGGTARYISLNAHEGLEQSRRDDLESIGHMLLYLYLGKLPWSHYDMHSAEYADLVANKKKITPLSEICRGAPKEFEEYMEQCRGLSFEQQPDYDALYKMFHSCRPDTVKDYDLEWLRERVDFDPAMLEPLEPRARVPQPDDLPIHASRKRRSLMRLMSMLKPRFRQEKPVRLSKVLPSPQ